MSLPALFISHGSPMTILDPIPARDFLAGLGGQVARPRAILAVSAHWETERPTLASAAHPPIIHDYYGFPDALYRLSYPAPGAPELAGQVAGLLIAAGFACADDPARGLDHGVWMPLLLGWPAADIPVLALSMQPAAGPAHHLRLGAALAPLRAEGVLILASGAMTHNLRAVFKPEAADPDPRALAFVDWMAEHLAAGDESALLNYRAQAPDATWNHPSDEHLLPLYVAMGAGGWPARALHRSMAYRALAMDSWAFGAG